MSTKDLIEAYWNSWQVPTDFDEMSSYLDKDLKMDSGMFKFDKKDDFVNFCKANPTPWKDVQMIQSMFFENGGAILYEGTNTANNSRMRVAELIQIKDGKIFNVQTVITVLPQ